MLFNLKMSMILLWASKQQVSAAEPRHSQVMSQELIINSRITVVKGQTITEVAKLNY